jgi:hypothetical protein
VLCVYLCSIVGVGGRWSEVRRYEVCIILCDLFVLCILNHSSAYCTGHNLTTTPRIATQSRCVIYQIWFTNRHWPVRRSLFSLSSTRMRLHICTNSSNHSTWPYSCSVRPPAKLLPHHSVGALFNPTQYLTKSWSRKCACLMPLGLLLANSSMAAWTLYPHLSTR